MINEATYMDRSMKKHWIFELMRYLVAGGIAFILDFAVLMFSYKVLGIHYLVAAGLGLSVGLVTTYLLSIKWVFNHRAMTKRSAELTLFMIIGSIGFVINEVMMWWSVEWMDFSVAWAKIVATGVVFAWNFTARKVLLFKAKTLGESKSTAQG